MDKIETFTKEYLKKDLPEIRQGDTVKIYEKIRKKKKDKIQIFEGIIIAKKHGKGIQSTFTVRKISLGVTIEKIFPLHSLSIEKIEILERAKVRRAKLYYLRKKHPKKLKHLRQSSQNIKI